MYRASQTLVDILENNGFRNKSHQYVADYGEKFKTYKPYNAGAYKREYGMGTGKRKLGFYFDYINMAVTDRSAYITDSYMELDEAKLCSIIAFFHCSYARQETIKRYTSNRIELAGEIMRKQRNIGVVEAPFDLQFERLFNEVIL